MHVERVKRLAFGCLLACLASGCGVDRGGQDDTPVRSGRSASGSGVAQLPQIDPAGLDVALAKSINEAAGAVQLDSLNDERWGRLGMLLLAHDLFEPAAKCLSEAARLDVNEPRWPYYESVALRTQDPNAAVDRLRRAIELFGDGSNVPRIRLATMLIDQERLEEAASVLSAVLSRESENTAAQVAMARIHLLENQPRQALECIDRARKSSSPTRTMQLLAAEAHRRLGNTQAATKCSEVAAKLPDSHWEDPIYQRVLALRIGLKTKLTEADLLFQQNRVDESMQLLQRLTAEYPDSEWSRVLLARAYIRKRNLKEAEAELKEALRLNPDSFQAHFRMGVLCQIGGQHQRTVEWFEKTVQLQPSSGVTYKNLALSRLLLGDRQGACTRFQTSD